MFDNIARLKKIEQLKYNPDNENPRDVIYNALSDSLRSFGPLFGSRVMVATAPTPVRKSSLLLDSDYAQKQINEGRWLGKCGLILKMGPTAFTRDPRFPELPWDETIHGEKPQIGEWIYYKTSSTWEAGIATDEKNGVPVRYVYDTDVVGIIYDIEKIY